MTQSYYRIPSLQPLAVFSVLAMALTPAVTQASEVDTVMPASACKLTGYQGGDTMSQSFAGQFQNAGSSLLLATCPIARSVYDSTSLEYASVLVSGDVTCDLVLGTSDGEFTRVRYTTTATVGDKTRLEWGSGDANISVPAAGTYAFECVMQSSTTLYRYTIEENDGED